MKKNLIFYFFIFYIGNNYDIFTQGNKVKVEDLKIINNLYRLIYLYPNIMGGSISLNIAETAQRNNLLLIISSIILEQKLVVNLSNKLINNLSRNLIYNKIGISDYNLLNILHKEKNFTAQCLSIFFENWILEEFNYPDFLLWLDEILKKNPISQSENKDKIIIYMVAINDNWETINEAYNSYNKENNSTSQKQSIENFEKIIKKYCLFFPILSINQQGRNLYKVSYPGRINYNLLIYLENSFGHSIQQPCKFADRFLLINILESYTIADTKLIDILYTISMIFINNEYTEENLDNDKKIKTIRNFINTNILTQDKNFLNILYLYYFYYLLQKNDNLSMEEKNKMIQKVKLYTYYQLCELLSFFHYGNYIRKINEK